jgi:hypothetical protein
MCGTCIEYFSRAAVRGAPARASDRAPSPRGVDNGCSGAKTAAGYGVQYAWTMSMRRLFPVASARTA